MGTKPRDREPTWPSLAEALAEARGESSPRTAARARIAYALKLSAGMVVGLIAGLVVFDLAEWTMLDRGEEAMVWPRLAADTNNLIAGDDEVVGGRR